MLIRWSRLIPRLIILALLLVAAVWARNELIRWQIGVNIESQTGAGVEIGAVDSDWRAGTVMLSNLRLFDRNDPGRELFQSNKLVVRAHPHDLLFRFFHIPQADIEGIKIVVDGFDREAGFSDRFWPEIKERIPDEMAMLGDFDFTVFFTEKPEVAAQKLLRQFETSRLSEELQRRWPAQLKTFEQASSSLEQRFQNVKNLFESLKTQEDKIGVLNGILEQFEQADLETRKLFDAGRALKENAQQDYKSLENTALRDRDTLKTIQPPDVNVQELSKTLVGSEIKEQWNKTVSWGQWARSLLVPAESEKGQESLYERLGLNPPKRQRGETIPLAALDARPELLVEKTNLSGQMILGEIPVFFNGSVSNMAYPAELGIDPMTARFCFSGSGVPTSPEIPPEERIAASQLVAVVDPKVMPNIYVTLSVDRTGGGERDELTVRCPMYQLPQQTLGDPEKLAVVVSPGFTALDGVLRLRGEHLSGQIRLVQSNIALEVKLPEKLQGSPLHRLLRQSLASLENLVSEIHVTGTRSEPQYAFHTNLADRLLPRIEELVRQEWGSILESTGIGLTEEANRAVGILDSAFRGKIDPALNEINEHRNLLEQQIVQGGVIDQLAQSGMARLSAKDRERLERFTTSPSVQNLLQSIQREGTIPPEQVDRAIQKGVDQLQEKLPGLLDRLRKK